MRQRTKYLVIPILAIFLVACFPGISKAAAAESCYQTFAPVSRQQNAGAKTFNEVIEQVENVDLSALKAKISSVYGDPTLDRQRQNKKAFDLYLDFRLKGFAFPIRKEILRRIKNTKVIHNSIEVAGRYHFDLEFLEIELPKQYFGTILEFGVRVHEIEHLIQDVQMGKWKLTESDLKKKHFTESIFSSEKGAMLAEANFLLSLPKEVVREELKESAKQFGLAYKFQFGALHAASSTAYVQIQWDKFDRYSKTQLEDLYFSQLATTGGILGAAAATSVFAIMQFFHLTFGF